MRYMLLIYGCDRPEPGDPRFEGALERVNSFVEECRPRGVLRGADPLRPASTATSLWRAYKVTDEQVARVVEATGSQRAAFELILAAALGASLHRWRCGLKALEEALNKSAQSRLPATPG